MSTSRSDVVIIGGGPAGSALSTLLTKGGLTVTVLEKSIFPRDHIGESLIPSTLSTLERLGVLSKIEERGYLKKRGTSFLWGGEKWTVYFSEGRPEAEYAYQVWRADFDSILLNNARDCGVTVVQPALVTGLIESKRRIRGVIFKEGGITKRHLAQLVVDASGQNSFIARRLRLRQWDPGFQNMALYGYFKNVEKLPGIDATNTLIEAYPQGWFWDIPLHVGFHSIGTVIGSHEYQKLRHRAWKSNLLDLMSETQMVRQLCANSTMVAGPHLTRDWSYSAARFVGQGFMLIGDAACFIDPLFSTGVHLALQQAVNAAASIKSWLALKVSEDDAFRFYDEEYKEEYQDLRQLALTMYSAVAQPKESVFQNARTIQGLSDAVSIRRAFVHLIAGRTRRGFELSPLSRLDLNPRLMSELTAYELALRERSTALVGISPSGEEIRILKDSQEIDPSHPFWEARLEVDSTTFVQKSLVVMGDRLESGSIVKTPLNPRGVRVNAFVTDELLPTITPRLRVAELVDWALARRKAAERPTRSELAKQIANLYWYGALQLVSEDA